jgi:hypothetical protein
VERRADDQHEREWRAEVKGGAGSFTKLQEYSWRALAQAKPEPR